MTAVGWTGQCYSSFEQVLSGVHFQAKQEDFKAYLTPGEKVRSPLVSLSFYETGKPAKGFNIYRSYSKDCVVNENIEQRVYQCASGSVDDVRATVDAINSSGVSEYIDTFWFDAEKWFYKKAASSWRNSAGDWTARKDWYPNGFVEVSDILKENNIAELRQDFNINPLSYWQKNDEKNRSGITENHYVTKSTDKKTWVAMQYGTGESGLVLAYRHKKADNTLTVKLCEVDPNAEYTVSFPFDDSAESISVSGKNLSEGFTVKSSALPEAIIIEYVVQ